MRVLAFEHVGLRFAVPHARARRVLSARPSDATALCLVRDDVSDRPDSSFLELVHEGSVAFVACRAAELVELEEPKPLSPLLRAAIGAPHVVGWALLVEELVWLVDVSRLFSEQAQGP